MIKCASLLHSMKDKSLKMLRHGTFDPNKILVKVVHRRMSRYVVQSKSKRVQDGL